MTDAKIIPLPDLKQIEATAANWIARFERDDLSSEDHAEFQSWFAQSEQHKASFLRLNDLWGGLDILENLKDIAVSDDVVECVEQSKNGSANMFFRKLATWSIAASLIVLSVGGLYQLAFFNTADFEAKYQTTIGEQQTVALPDGSDMLLNTGTVAEVKFSRSGRNIFLETGEAFFNVAEDASRPFVVSTEKGSVTAVGTAFSVSLRGENVDVVVTEGRVALSSAVKTTEGSQATLRYEKTLMEITAGQTVAFSDRVEHLGQIELDVIDQKLDWRDGVLSFKGEPLEQVIADVSPYTSLSIEIHGEDLKQQPIGGYFKVGEIESLFEALSLMANVKVERLDNEQIRLYRDDIDHKIR